MTTVAIAGAVTWAMFITLAVYELYRTAQTLLASVNELSRREGMSPLERAIEDLEKRARGL